MSASRERTEEADADQGAGKVEQALEEVGAALVADVQAPEAEPSRPVPLDCQAIPTEALG